MKIALLLVVPLLFVSCRTYTPVNPNTMKPSACMLPKNMRPGIDYGVNYSDPGTNCKVNYRSSK